MKVMYILLQIYTMSLLNICVYYLIERKIRVFGGVHKVNSNEKHSCRCQDRKPNSFQTQPFQMERIKC